MATKFGEWLQNELDARRWSQREFSRRSKVSIGTISNAINGVYEQDKNTLLAFAKALRLPKEVLFREAGVLPDVPEATAQSEQALHLFRQLNEADKTTILRMMEVMLDK